MRKITFWCAAAMFASAAVLSARTYFKGTCDKDALSYMPGEQMVFTVSLMEDGKHEKRRRFFRSKRAKPLVGASALFKGHIRGNHIVNIYARFELLYA